MDCFRHPEMKRLLCQCCNMILWAPLTANVHFSKNFQRRKRLTGPFHLDKRKTGIIVTCSTCGRSRTYPKQNSWPTEYGARTPSDWRFDLSSSAAKEKK